MSNILQLHKVHAREIPFCGSEEHGKWTGKAVFKKLNGGGAQWNILENSVSPDESQILRKVDFPSIYSDPTTNWNHHYQQVAPEPRLLQRSGAHWDRLSHCL